MIRILIFFFMMIFSASTAKSGFLPARKWFSVQNPKAVAILVAGHGLHPELMDSMALQLNKNGISAVRLALRGHRGDFEEWKNVSREQWLTDIRIAHQLALNISDEHLGIPVLFIGHSMGGLLGSDYMVNGNPGKLFDGMILFAPAWEINVLPKAGLQIGGLIQWLPKGDRIELPAQNPIPEYNINPFNSPASLQGLNESRSEFLKHAPGTLKSVPGLIFMNDEDSTVDGEKIKADIENWELSDLWKVESVTHRNCTYQKCEPHQVFAEQMVSQAEWIRITGIINKFVDSLVKFPSK